MSLCCDVIIWTFKSCQIYFFVFCVCVCVILWSTLDANIRCSSGVILNFGCKNLAGKLEIKIPNSSTFEQCLEICLCYWHQIFWDYAYWKYRTKSIGFWPDEYNSCVRTEYGKMSSPVYFRIPKNRGVFRNLSNAQVAGFCENN